MRTLRTLAVLPVVLVLLAGCDSLVGEQGERATDFDIVVFRVEDKVVEESGDRLVVDLALDYPSIEGRVYARVAASLEDYQRMSERTQCIVARLEGRTEEECPKDVQARLPHQFPFEEGFVSVNYELEDGGRTLRMTFEGTEEQLNALKQTEVVVFYYYYL